MDGGGSYISAGDPRLHFGLGDASHIDRLEVPWPSGRIETHTDLPVNRVIEWTDGTTTDP